MVFVGLASAVNTVTPCGNPSLVAVNAARTITPCGVDLSAAHTVTSCGNDSTANTSPAFQFAESGEIKQLKCDIPILKDCFPSSTGTYPKSLNVQDYVLKDKVDVIELICKIKLHMGHLTSSGIDNINKYLNLLDQVNNVVEQNSTLASELQCCIYSVKKYNNLQKHMQKMLCSTGRLIHSAKQLNNNNEHFIYTLITNFKSFIDNSINENKLCVDTSMKYHQLTTKMIQHCYDINRLMMLFRNLVKEDVKNNNIDDIVFNKTTPNQSHNLNNNTSSTTQPGGIFGCNEPLKFESESAHGHARTSIPVNTSAHDPFKPVGLGGGLGGFGYFGCNEPLKFESESAHGHARTSIPVNTSAHDSFKPVGLGVVGTGVVVPKAGGLGDAGTTGCAISTGLAGFAVPKLGGLDGVAEGSTGWDWDAHKSDGGFKLGNSNTTQYCDREPGNLATNSPSSLSGSFQNCVKNSLNPGTQGCGVNVPTNKKKTQNTNMKSTSKPKM
jgi:hypothetical protein